MTCKGVSPTAGGGGGGVFLARLSPPHHPPSPHGLQATIPMILGTPGSERVKHPAQDRARLHPVLWAFGCPSAGRSGNEVTLWVSRLSKAQILEVTVWGTNR